jgi:hypothetical protein
MKLFGNLTSSIQDNIKTRVNDPIIGAFVCSWILFNWDRLAVLFFGSDKIESRIERLSNDMGFFCNPWLIFSNLDLLLLPIAFTVFYVFFMPKVSVIVVKILAKTDVERYGAVVDREVQQAAKQRELNAERLLGDPGEKFLAEEVEEKLAQERAIREKMEAEAEKARDEALAEKERAGKETADKKLVQLEVEKKEREAQVEKMAFSESAAINKAVLYANTYNSSYLFLQLLDVNIKQDGINVSLEGLTGILAAIFGYNDYAELLDDSSFNNDSLRDLKYVLCDSDYLSARLDTILAAEKFADDSFGSEWMLDHIQTLFEDLPYQFVFEDSLEDLVFERIEADQFDLLNSDEIASAQAETNTILEEMEFHGREHSFGDNKFVVEISGSASGHHRKEEGMSSPGVDFMLTATLPVSWGKYGLKDYEIELAASPEDWGAEEDEG